jgi:hypothetical protein
MPVEPPRQENETDTAYETRLEAYYDTLGLDQRNKGANGSHRMRRALNIVNIAVVNRDDQDIGMASIASDPHPVIILDSVSTSDVTVHNNIAYLTIKGSVYDPIADIVGQGQADIQSVFFDEQIVPVTKMADNRGADPVRRPFAFHGRFEIPAAVVLNSGDNVVMVDATNLIGNGGSDSLTIRADVSLSGPAATDPVVAQEYPFDEPVSLTFTGPLQSAATDTIIALVGDPASPILISELVETTADSRIFTSDELRVTLPPEVGMAPGIVDDFQAAIEIHEGNPAVFAFTETSDDSKTFTVDARMLTVTFDQSPDPTIADQPHVYLGDASMNPDNDRLTETSPEGMIFAGSTADLGESTVELVPVRGIDPSRPDLLSAKLTSSIFNEQNARITLLETGNNSLVFKTVGLGFHVGGVPQAQQVIATVSGISVANDEGSDEGVNNPLTVRFGQSQQVPPRDSALFAGARFDLVDDAVPGVKRLDRPLMLVQRPVPTAISNVRYVKDVHNESDLEIAYGGVTRAFGVLWTAPNPADAPKLARGTTVSLIVNGRGKLPLPPKNEWTVQFVHDDFSMPINLADIQEISAPTSKRMQFRVKVSVPVNAPLEKMALTIAKNGANLLTCPSAFEVSNLKTILIGIDGMNADLFKQAIQTGAAPTFAKVIGRQFENAEMPNRGGIDEGVATNSLPSITWCNWATIFTGLEPKDHGITGNSFFKRDIISSFDRPVFSANAERAGDNFNLAGAVFKGLDEHLKTGTEVKTIYEQLPKTARTVCINHFYARGADEETSFPGSEMRSGAEINFLPGIGTGIYFYNKGTNIGTIQEHSSAAATRLDKLSAHTTVRGWRRRHVPDLTCVYFPGPDNVGHAKGLGGSSSAFPQTMSNSLQATYDHLCQVTDGQFARIVKQVDDSGYGQAVMYVFVSDHGLVGIDTTTRTDGFSDKVFQIRETKRKIAGFGKQFVTTTVRQDEMKRFFDLMNPNSDTDVTWLGENAEALNSVKRIVYAPNGGLAHIYFRDGDLEWTDAPRSDSRGKDVLDLARAIYRQARRGFTGDLETNFPQFKGALGDETQGEIPAILVRNPTNAAEYLVLVWDEATSIPAFRAIGDLETSLRKWIMTDTRIADLVEESAAGSRAGDIILLFNMREGYASVQEGDEFPGWHGGPSQAESRTPFFAAFSGLKDFRTANTFIHTSLTGAIVGGPARNRHITPFIKKIFDAVWLP